MTYKCNICSKLLDNNNNLSQHEKDCKKHHEAAKETKQKKKKGHYKSTHTTQLKFKYGTILHEENIIIEKLKQTKFKIKDRQCQILKLEELICAHKKKNNSGRNYLTMQISILQDQVCKFNILIQDLSDKKMELHSQKKVIASKLKLFSGELSTHNSDIPVTKKITQ